MMNSGPYWLVFLVAGCLPSAQPAFAKVTVTVAFATTNSTALHRGFSGFNTAFGVGNTMEYYDANLQSVAATLSPGWLRYPAGTRSDAFAWTNGILVQPWIDSMAAQSDASVATILQNDLPIVVGKGGAQFSDFADMAAKLNARIIVCVNAFTDPPESASSLARYALSNNISVAAWELANEPYLFVGSSNFFSGATDYANKMKPYRDAIKAVDANAVVALFFSRNDDAWGIELGHYGNQYWDAVTYHHYPGMGSRTNFSDFMAKDNDVLVNDTTNYVLSYLMTNTPPETTFLITEYDPTLSGVPNGTLYGGIYTAEYALRMSTIPRMHFVGMQELVNAYGIDTTNNYQQDVTKAYNSGRTTNTTALNFGYYVTAQALAASVANGGLARSDAVYPTTVTGGSEVPKSSGGNIPAIYAQAYEGVNGKRYVVLTNKGASNEVAQLLEDGLALTNHVQMTFVTGTDPSLVNTNPPSNNVQVRTLMVANPEAVAIPPYSVVRFEWQVFPVPAPQLTARYSNSIFELSWTGLTNVNYLLQTSTNLFTWATLSTYSGAATNKHYSALPTGPFRYYRVIVP